MTASRKRLHCAIDIAPLGPLADPTTIADLAAIAESAGWDGISVWDSLGTSIGTAAADPFVALAAAAARTDRLRLIASVIALPRRRPQLVAQAAATLDRWGGGRLILGVGTGGDAGDFEPFGESFDAARRAAMLDEGLGLVDRFLRGGTVTHQGPMYTAQSVAVGPGPIQRPRPPIWIGGMKSGALRRAALWDGWVALAVSEETYAMGLTPEDFGAMVARCRAARHLTRRSETAFDIAVLGVSDPGYPKPVADFAAAGATWWLESLSPMRGSIDELRARVAVGPPVGRPPHRPRRAQLTP